MVLLERIELSTSPLPRECSTSELQQRRARLIRPKHLAAQATFGDADWEISAAGPGGKATILR